METRYIFIAAAALIVSACAIKSEPIEELGQTITIEAIQVGNGALTKTAVQDGGTSVYWEPSDEVKVFYDGEGSRFVSNNTDLVGVAKFTGTLSTVIGFNEGFSNDNPLWGLYPYRADATSDGSSVTTTLPAEQVGRAGSFAKNTHITMGRSTSLSMGFYSVCGGVRFSVSQEGISKVVFEGNSNEQLAGTIKLAFEGGIPVVKSVTDGATAITLTAPYSTFEIGTWYYIEAIPGALSNGYTLTFFKDNKTAVKSGNCVTIRRGVFGSLENADAGLAFSDGGDTPDPSSFIQFEDPIAKYACVEKFDTNGDGEVSYDEAAKVTDLTGLFSNWNTVSLFSELKYFSSVTSTEGVFTGLKNLKEIVIPNNIKSLGTFKDCSSLTDVVLPLTLNSIPPSCFEGCEMLINVVMPSAIASIPDKCFMGCASLKEMKLPDTILTIGNYAFSDCSTLIRIDLPSGLNSIYSYAFQNCVSLSSVDFPGTLKSIGNYSFLSCTSLKSLIINSGVQVGGHAFKFCSSIESVYLGNNSSYGSYCFAYNTCLGQVKMEEGVSAGSFMFYGCRSLSSIELPLDMTSIPNGMFQLCCNINTIKWPENLKSISKYAFCNCRFASCDGSLVLPSTIESIGESAFIGIKHLTIPSTTPVSISSSSFSPSFTHLYVPTSMVEMYKVRTNWSFYSDYIFSISDYPSSKSLPIGEAIDLGLSVKWANCNLGAESPEDFGLYYAWGEVSPKMTFYYDNYELWYGSYHSIIKYNYTSNYGEIDNLRVLELEDDAAYVNWGPEWRMPTIEEMRELYNNCTWQWITTDNSVYGVKVTSKKPGYTNNSIFIPAAGMASNDSSWHSDTPQSLLLWTSSLQSWNQFSSEYGQQLSFNDSFTPEWYVCYSRSYGLPIRPVHK